MSWRLPDGLDGERTGDAVDWLRETADVRATRNGRPAQMAEPLIRFYLDCLHCAVQWAPAWAAGVTVPDESGILQLAKWAAELAIEAGHRSDRPEAREVVAALLERCTAEAWRVSRG